MLEESRRVQEHVEMLQLRGEEIQSRNNSLQIEIDNLKKKLAEREKESRSESVKNEGEITRLSREIQEKNGFLNEMEHQSAKALDTIIRLENENKDIIRDYDWIRNELEENN